jgi:hypothetical protein
MVERESTRALQDDVVIGDAYLGGGHIGKAGRGSENNVLFVAAVEVNTIKHSDVDIGNRPLTTTLVRSSGPQMKYPDQ